MLKIAALPDYPYTSGNAIGEVWKESQYPGYLVSSHGRVFSQPKDLTKLNHWSGQTIKYRGRATLRKSYRSSNGYLGMSGFIINGKMSRMRKSVHRLVAETFIPNPEGKPVVHHINGKRDDNRVSNLSWATQKENVRHWVSKTKVCAKCGGPA